MNEILRRKVPVIVNDLETIPLTCWKSSLRASGRSCLANTGGWCKLPSHMPLVPGTRLGPYEILMPAGAGGQGEVYKARDTRLNRTVAVKVLPSHLSAGEQARQRFQREGATLGSLH